MIWKDPQLGDETPWKPWFAWYPVLVGINWHWLERVNRKFVIVPRGNPRLPYNYLAWEAQYEVLSK